MPQTTCACSTTATTHAHEVIPGLAQTDLSNINVIQGVDYTWRQCFTQGEAHYAILEEAVGGNLTISEAAAKCLAVGDKIRLVNYDKCKPDTDDKFSVFPVAAIGAPVNGRSVVTLTGLNSVDKVYEAASTTAGSQYSPIGCPPDAVAAADSLPPYLMVTCDGSPVILTGGITARDDYYQSFAVAATAGSPVLTSTELGKVQPGDSITGAGLTNARVLRVDSEEVQNAAGQRIKRDRITLDIPATVSSSCVEIKVQRGLIVSVDIRKDGDCWEITIPAYATSQLQLHKNMRKGDGYAIGTLTILGYYGVLKDGKLIQRSFPLLRSNVTLNASHAGV